MGIELPAFGNLHADRQRNLRQRLVDGVGQRRIQRTDAETDVERNRMLIGQNSKRVGKQIAVEVCQRRRISPDARRLTINGGGDGIIVARETHQLRVFVCLFQVLALQRRA